MDILSPFPETNNVNQHVLGINDRYSMRTRAFLMSKKTAQNVASILLNHWIFRYGIPNTTLSENGTQFVVEFYKPFVHILCIRRKMATTYHPETTAKSKHTNVQTPLVCDIIYQKTKTIRTSLYNHWPTCTIHIYTRWREPLHSTWRLRVLHPTLYLTDTRRLHLQKKIVSHPPVVLCEYAFWNDSLRCLTKPVHDPHLHEQRINDIWMAFWNISPYSKKETLILSNVHRLKPNPKEKTKTAHIIICGTVWQDHTKYCHQRRKPSQSITTETHACI